MAVQNHIYIYIGKNGAPTILNVDNAADGAVLEQLGAIKMPEAMASEVFGENARYADNSTCTITENPDNAEFPFNVAFDSSKISEKPKRNTEILAGIGMPSDQFIDITSQIEPWSALPLKKTYKAPADGYIHVCANSNNLSTSGLFVYVFPTADADNYYYFEQINPVSGNMIMNVSFLVPIKKGFFYAIHANSSKTQAANWAKFIYAEGAL